MKKVILIIPSVLIAVVLLISCNNCPDLTNNIPLPDDVKTESETTSAVSSPTLTPIAKTITYDVLIRNPNEEDEWTSETLKDVDAKTLIDKVFDAVYAGRATPYSVLTDEKMDIDMVKDIEAREDYSRELIGKIQFVEEWKLNETTLLLDKKVKQIMLAYEKYDENTQLIGYTATFVIKFD